MFPFVRELLKALCDERFARHDTQRFQNALVPYAPAGDLDVNHFTAGVGRIRRLR